MGLRQFFQDILVLGKFRISVMAVFTGYAAIAVEGSHAADWGFIAPCLIALLLMGMGANTLNQIIERDKDAAMSRTKRRRPLPSGRVSVAAAITVASVEVLASLVILQAVYGSWLATALAALTVIYYSFIYTVYLKPWHYLNIVVGGVPGAMGPLIAWAAITDATGVVPIAMFLLIFLWTPPHVWALAIRLKEDYARARIPMLPVVKGVDETTRQIFWYTVVLVVFSLLLPLVSQVFRSPIYVGLASLLGSIFLIWTWIVWKRRPIMPTMPLFRYSLVYIGVLFLGLVVDALIRQGGG